MDTEAAASRTFEPTEDGTGTAPNILVIVTDDQGPWAMPDQMPELHMPTLRALQAESVEFRQAYCASPVCSPSRASMLTGRMPSAHGVHDWLVGGRWHEAWPDRHIDGQPTTPEQLAQHGYRCALVGKWHVGDARWPAPGFEYWYAHRFGGGPYYDAPIWADGEPATEPEYYTDAVTEKALDFLSTTGPEDSFYLHVAYTAPHTPWLGQHPEHLTGLYEGCTFPSVPREEPHPWVEPRQEAFQFAFDDPQPSLVGYCASLSGVDAGLQRILDQLKQDGRWDDTIVIYVSDNGFACGHHGIWGKGNGTYPVNFWDSSVRVPLLVRVPGVDPRVETTVTSTAYLHRTICALAGVQPQPDRWGLPGLLPIEPHEPPGAPEYVVCCTEYGDGRMITDGRWKYVWRSSGEHELYDRASDPEERENLFSQGSTREVVTELDARLREHFERYSRPGYEGTGRGVKGFGQLQPLSRGAEHAFAETDL